jgi:FkbM family methyltransferase
MTIATTTDLASLLAEAEVDADARAEQLIARELPNGNQALVLCGAGWLGRKMLDGLRRNGVTPLAFADNDRRLHGQSIDGVPVKSVGDAVRELSQATFVITAYNPSELSAQLRSLGVVPASSRALAFANASTLLPQNAIDLPSTVLRDADDVLAAANLWADEESKAVYEHLLRWHLLLAPPARAASPGRDTYFPPSIVHLSDDEQFVDCGAFDGDSVRGFLELTGGRFSRIDAMEPDPDNLRKLRSFIATLPVEDQQRIYVHPVAVGRERRTLRFRHGVGPASTIAEEGEYDVACVSLDEELAAAAPTYVKVDVEGAEPDVIRGAAHLITKHAPTMAVVLYHRTSDMWTIPLALRQLRSDYRLYLRRYAEDCWETVCHAVRS